MQCEGDDDINTLLASQVNDLRRQEFFRAGGLAFAGGLLVCDHAWQFGTADGGKTQCGLSDY